MSALIHAATLVTAGVYLMLRSAPLLEYGPTTLIVTAWVGALTALFAATSGLLQSDLKRVIAYSTCSQIGYLFASVGLSNYNLALFHLVNHAWFKSMLFLAAGAVIHGMADQQDLRRLGGLLAFMPFTYTALLIGSLSLMAMPFLTGFYSKDAILELAAGTYTTSGALVYWIGTGAAALTAFYSFRLLSLAFFSHPSAPKGDYLHAHEAPGLIVVPLVFLAVLSIGFGYVASDLFRGAGTDFLSTVFHVHPGHLSLVEAEFALPQVIKLLPGLVTILSAALAFVLYQVTPQVLVALKDTLGGKALYRFFAGQWHWNSLITGLFIVPVMSLGHVVSKVIDRGIIEAVGPYGLSQLLPMTGQRIAEYDTSLVTTYALYVMLGLLFLVLLLFAPFFAFMDHMDLKVMLLFILGVSMLPTQST